MENKTLQNYIINSKLDLKQMVSDYSNYIYIIAKNITNNLLTDEDIEELTSDVLLAIWKNKENIERNAPLKPYIAGITKNITKNMLRRKKHIVVQIETIENLKNDISLEEIVEDQEYFNEIEKQLAKMKKIDRQIFIMFYCYGKKAKQIAEEIGYTEENVNVKLHRIKKKLRKTLNERGWFYGNK